MPPCAAHVLTLRFTFHLCSSFAGVHHHLLSAATTYPSPRHVQYMHHNVPPSPLASPRCAPARTPIPARAKRRGRHDAEMAVASTGWPRVVVVGAGPAGFYTAINLLKAFREESIHLVGVQEGRSHTSKVFQINDFIVATFN